MTASIHCMYDMQGNNPEVYPLVNGFSLNMLGQAGLAYGTQIQVVPLAPETVRGLPLKSCIGHADTAAIVASILGRDIRPNRATISLAPGESIVVAQYFGPRLPEGTTVLPEGAAIEFALVSIGRNRPVVKVVEFTVYDCEGFNGDVCPIPQVVFPDREHD